VLLEVVEDENYAYIIFYFTKQLSTPIQQSAAYLINSLRGSMKDKEDRTKLWKRFFTF